MFSRQRFTPMLHTASSQARRVVFSFTPASHASVLCVTALRFR
jgi:hypothetical protein